MEQPPPIEPTILLGHLVYLLLGISNHRPAHAPTPPYVPLLRALWSLLDGTLGFLKGQPRAPKKQRKRVMAQTSTSEFPKGALGAFPKLPIVPLMADSCSYKEAILRSPTVQSYENLPNYKQSVIGFQKGALNSTPSE